MGACGKRYEQQRQPRICELEQGHEGACLGACDPQLYRGARRAAKERHRSMEEAHRQEVESLTVGPLGRPWPADIAIGLSPAEFAAEVLKACEGGCPASELPGRLGLPIRVNRLMAGPRELRQVLARLKRDGQLEERSGNLYSLATRRSIGEP